MDSQGIQCPKQEVSFVGVGGPNYVILPSDKSTLRLGERNPTSHRKQGHSSCPAFEIGLPAPFIPSRVVERVTWAVCIICRGILLPSVTDRVAPSCFTSLKNHGDFLTSIRAMLSVPHGSVINIGGIGKWKWIEFKK